MAVLAWGKPRIFVKKLGGGGSWIELPTPVEGSTQLSTTKGNKNEAKIEGGENEDVKYNRNTYALALNIRAVEGRAMPIIADDGVIGGQYAVVLQPENPASQGFAFLKSAASVEDTFTTADGGVWNYTFDALKQDAKHKQIYWGQVIVTEQPTGTISKIEIDPSDTTGAEDKIEVGADA